MVGLATNSPRSDASAGRRATPCLRPRWYFAAWLGVALASSAYAPTARAGAARAELLDWSGPSFRVAFNGAWAAWWSAPPGRTYRVGADGAAAPCGPRCSGGAGDWLTWAPDPVRDQTGVPRRYAGWRSGQSWYLTAESAGLPDGVVVDGGEAPLVPAATGVFAVGGEQAGWAGAWLGGEFARRQDAGSPVAVATAPELRALLDAVHAAAVGVEQSQRCLVPGRLDVIVIPAEEGASANGMGRVAGAVLELPTSPLPTDELTALLAHEAMHRLVGIELRVPDRDEDRWLLEGVTEYLALWLLADQDASWRPRFVRRLMQAHAADGSAPAGGVSDSAAYHLGFARAAWLDGALRAAPGAGGLSSLLAGFKGKAVVTGADVESAALVRLRAEERRRWAASRNRPDLLVESLVGRMRGRVEQRQAHVGHAGVTLEYDERGAARVREVARGGPAERAGLRRGDQLASVPRLDVPAGAVVPFRVLGEAGSRLVRVTLSAGVRRFSVLASPGPESFALPGWRPPGGSPPAACGEEAP